MRSFILFTLALTLAAVTTPTQARLGETSDQCIARYGTVIHADNTIGFLMFQRAGFLIGVMIQEGKCESIRFEKAQKDAIGTAAKMSPTEIETLLTSNGADEPWKQTRDKGLTHEWQHPTGNVALYDAIEHTLLITTPAAIARNAAKAKARDQENLEGF